MTLQENTILLKVRLQFIAGFADDSIGIFMSILITVLSDEATSEIQRGIPSRDVRINTVEKIIEFILTFYGTPIIDESQ